MKKRLLPTAFIFDIPTGYSFPDGFKNWTYKQRKKYKRRLNRLASSRADLLKLSRGRNVGS